MRWIVFQGFFLFLSLVTVFPAKATQLAYQPLYRGARAQAMGNAFTAVADDEEAIFYNPAGLAGIKKLAVNLLDLNTEFSKDLVYGYPKLLASTSNLGASTIDSLMGQHLYSRIQDTASIVGPGFGIAFLADQQFYYSERNRAMPQVTLGIQSTYGVQFAMGSTVAKIQKRRGEIRVGVAGKVMRRSGGYQTPSLTQMIFADSSMIKNNVNNFGTGLGADLGLQYVYTPRKKRFSFQAGVAMKDIGDMTFSTTSASRQESNLTAGIAAIYKTRDLQATLAFDYSNILDPIEWKKKDHYGLELAFSGLSLYGGLNQYHLTYGAGFDLWLFKVTALSYAEEQATLVGQDPERRYLLHLGVRFEL